MVSEELSVADVAFTEEPTLAVPNFMVYREYAAQLLQDSRVEEFWLPWRSVAEVVHVPPTPMPAADVNFAGGRIPIRRIVCTQVPCARCDSARAGFQFPWLPARGTSPQDAYAAYSRCHDGLSREAFQARTWPEFWRLRS